MRAEREGMPVGPSMEAAEEERWSPSLEAVLPERSAALLRARRERAEAAAAEVERVVQALAVVTRNAEDLARRLACARQAVCDAKRAVREAKEAARRARALWDADLRTAWAWWLLEHPHDRPGPVVRMFAEVRGVTVRQMWRLLGLRVQRTKEQREQCLRRALAGESLRALAREYHISHQRLSWEVRVARAAEAQRRLDVDMEDVSLPSLASLLSRPGQP
jgi:exonuclease VII large subunit